MTAAIEIPASLAGIKHIVPRQVVWGDMDAMRHVNNTKYFYYCETARIEFFRILDPNLMGDGPETIDITLALAEVGCRFKAQLSYPDNLLIGTYVENIEETQFLMKHLFYSEKLDCIAAEATARAVSFDVKLGKRAPIPKDTLKILQAHVRNAA